MISHDTTKEIFLESSQSQYPIPYLEANKAKQMEKKAAHLISIRYST